jgi:tetratricopeptide (TPR) repeat protein
VALAAAALSLLSQVAVRTQRVVAVQAAQEAWHAYQAGQADEGEVRASLKRAEEVASAEESLAEVRFSFEARVYRGALQTGAEAEELDWQERRVWAAAEAARLLNPADSRLERTIADHAYRVLTQAKGGGEARRRYFTSMRRLLELDPLDVTSRRQLAREYAGEGQYELMEAAFDSLFAIEPDDAAAWVLRGRYRLLHGDTEGALYAYVRAQEAVFNCRVKASVDAPRSQQYFDSVLRLVDLQAVRRRIAELRREAYR